MSQPLTAVAAPRTPLIINADDFGYSAAVNRAIIQAHRTGILTSTSLMINERAASEAIQLARENPALAVGLHLVLVLGHSALPQHKIPHLVNAQQEFTRSPFHAGIKYFFSPAARRELRLEMRAQFEKFAATKLPFSHVDGHTHLHQHPVIFTELIQLCEEFNVRRIRIVRGEINISLRTDPSQVIGKLVIGTVFNLLARQCEKKLQGRGFLVPAKVYGLLQTGKMTQDCWLKLLAALPRVPSEIYAHPLDPTAADWNKAENPRGEQELQALLSPRVRDAVLSAGFMPTSYEQMAQHL